MNQNWEEDIDRIGNMHLLQIGFARCVMQSCDGWLVATVAFCSLNVRALCV